MVQLPCPIVLDWKCQPALAGYKGVILMVMISSGGWCLARVLSRNRIIVCLELWTAAPSWAVCRGSVVVRVCWLPVNVRCPFLGHLHYKSSSSPMHDEFDDAHRQYFFFETRRSSTQKRQGVTPLPCREFPACHLLHSSLDLRFASSTWPEKTRVVRFFATFHNFISSHLYSPWFLSCHESHLLVRVFF